MIRTNVILEGSGAQHLYSLGVATDITFDNNDVPAPIAVQVHNSEPFGTYGGPTPYPNIVRVGGNASGTQAPVLV